MGKKGTQAVTRAGEREGVRTSRFLSLRLRSGVWAAAILRRSVWFISMSMERLNRRFSDRMGVRRIAGLCVGCLVGLLFGSAAHAQNALKNDDIGVSGFYQMTSTATGNGITVTPSHSGGGEASFRHSYHWWLGYEGAYTYTRFNNNYSNQLFGVQSNMHEFSGSYYVHGVTALGIQPFALAGVSAVIFSPSLNGGQNAAWQPRPGVNFGAGINYPLLTSHLGLRLEYRGVYYHTPDFGQAVLTTNTWRITSEPMVGVYFKF